MADNDLKIMDDGGAISVSSSVIGRILGVKDRRVRQLVEEGVLVRLGRGKYDLVKSVRNYILSLKAAFESEGRVDADAELDLDEERALHERVKRHISELKLSTMKGELHRGDDVSLVMADMLGSVRSKLLAIPSKLAPILASRSDVSFIKAQINNEIIEALNELKDYDPECFRSKDFVNDKEDDFDD